MHYDFQQPYYLKKGDIYEKENKQIIIMVIDFDYYNNVNKHYNIGSR